MSDHGSAPGDRTDKNEQSAFRDEIVRQIFGDVGKIEDDFSCAVESKILLHGRMYVTQKFICFYSNLFGLEKKIRIPYSHVTCITKENTALVIPNAIAIITHKKEYIFRSFWDREECYTLLTRWHEASKSEPGHVLGSSSPHRLDQAGETAAGKADANRPRTASEQQNDSASDRGGLQRHRTSPPGALGAIAAPGSSKPAAADDTASEKSSVDDAATHVSRQSTRASKRVSGSTDLGELDADIASSDAGDSTDADSDQDLQQAFQKEVDKRQLKTHVADMTLPVSVNTFFSLFVDDNAPFPFDKYHTDNGDKDANMSEWKAASEGIGYTRELRFIKPLSFSMGPSKTRAIKAQLLKRFGDHGLLLTTSTRLEDIPNGDCFCVDDVFIVRAKGDNECTLEIRMELNFFKSTMWKKIIESTTISETSKWLKDYADACLAFATSGGKAYQAAPPPREEAVVVEEAAPDVTVANPVNISSVGRAIILFVLLATCFFAVWSWKTSGAARVPNGEPVPQPHVPFFAAGDFAVWKDRFESMEQEVKRSTELLELQQNVIRELTAAIEKLHHHQRSESLCRKQADAVEAARLLQPREEDDKVQTEAEPELLEASAHVEHGGSEDTDVVV